MWIHARNGNWAPVSNDGIARKALSDGHEVFTTEDDADPRGKAVKPVKWDPDGEPVAEPEKSE